MCTKEGPSIWDGLFHTSTCASPNGIFYNMYQEGPQRLEFDYSTCVPRRAPVFGIDYSTCVPVLALPCTMEYAQ